MNVPETPSPDLSQLPPPIAPDTTRAADPFELPPPSLSPHEPEATRSPRRLGLIITASVSAVVLAILLFVVLITAFMLPSTTQTTSHPAVPAPTAHVDSDIPETGDDSAAEAKDADEPSIQPETAASGRWSSFRGLYPLFDRAEVDLPMINVISSDVPSPGSSVVVEDFTPLSGCYTTNSSPDEVGPPLNVTYCPADAPLPESLFSDLNPADGTANEIRNDDELHLTEERLLLRVRDMAVLMERP